MAPWDNALGMVMYPERETSINMYESKAAFFDVQAKAPWAADAYAPDEMAKLDALFARIGPLQGMKVLEPGCGTGRLTEILVQKVGPQGHILALDISRQMIAAAKQRLKNHCNIDLHAKAVEDVSLTSTHFDLVLCHQVFPHIRDKRKCLREFAGALRPAGKIVLYHFINLDQINDVHRKAGTVVENDMMPDKREMKQLFTGAGLKIEDIRDDEKGYFLYAKTDKRLS
jgi:ubiquinone/menaquinone biosynthesis C-methylase UbiE